jgi:hypothetical protein
MRTVDGVELPPVDLEAMEVHVLPAEGGLEDIAQAGRARVVSERTSGGAR